MKRENIPTSDRGFITWMHRHVYWYQLIQYTLEIAHGIESQNQEYLKAHAHVTELAGHSLKQTLNAWRDEHFEKAFSTWRSGMRATLDAHLQPYLPCTARRLFYRCIFLQL